MRTVISKQIKKQFYHRTLNFNNISINETSARPHQGKSYSQITGRSDRYCIRLIGFRSKIRIIPHNQIYGMCQHFGILLDRNTKIPM